MNPDDIIKVLQGSIAPTILISGVGLLLLTMTNRLARSIDRVRGLCKEIKDNHTLDPAQIFLQIDIFYQRCRYLQAAIAFATATILAVSTIIFFLFVMFTWDVNLVRLIEMVFTTGLI